MSEYILKSAVALSVTYLLYFIFARKNANFTWLRIYFLTAILVSFTFPALNYLTVLHRHNLVSVPSTYIPNWVEESSDAIVDVQGISSSPAPVKTNKFKLPLSDIMQYVYAAGVLVLLLRFIFGLTQLAWLAIRNRVQKIDRDRIVFVDNLPTPFSFFRLIFIERNDLTNVQKTYMLYHERVHVSQWHSVDLLLLEFITMVQWFNPFAWRIRRALKEIHEYLADEGTVKGDVSPLDYQHLLLVQACGLKTYLPVNGFKNSLTKKRILMITNNKRNRKWVAMFMLSVAIIVISDSLSRVNLAQNAPEKKNTANQPNQTTRDSKTNATWVKKTVKFTPPNIHHSPLYKGTSDERASLEATFKFIGKKLAQKSPEIRDAGKIVYIKFTVDENGKIDNVECANNDPSFPEKLKGPSFTKVTNRFPDLKAHINEMLSSLSVTDDPTLIKTAIEVISEMPDFTPGTDEKNNPAKKDVYTVVCFGGGIGAEECAKIEKFIDTHLTYPEEAKTNKIQGSLYVKFSVGKNGSVGNVTIVPPEEAKTFIQLIKTKNKLVPTDNEYLISEAMRVFKSISNYTNIIASSETLCNGRCRLDFYIK